MKHLISSPTFNGTQLIGLNLQIYKTETVFKLHVSKNNGGDKFELLQLHSQYS